MHTGVSRRKPKGYEKSAIRDGRSKPVTDKEKAKNIGLYNSQVHYVNKINFVQNFGRLANLYIFGKARP